MRIVYLTKEEYQKLESELNRLKVATIYQG